MNLSLISLPLIPGVPDSERKGLTRANLSGKRVVIVEDEAITQMQLRKILRQNGMVVVHSALNGLEGVTVTLTERPDLVLMDIRLPGDIDGLEAVRRILAQLSVCVVILTAVPNEEFQEQARAIGACGYIIKPIDRDTLFPQLQAAVNAFEKRENTH
jgi:two-component system, response regulator PdtaR